MARVGPWFPVASATSESRRTEGHSCEEGIDLQVHWCFLSRNHQVTGLNELRVWIQTGLGWIPGLATYCNSYCCPVTKSSLTLCDPMDCSTPGFPVPHWLPEFAQTHVHWVGNAIQMSILYCPRSCPQSFPASGSFLISRLFASGGQSTGASASASVLPMNIQGQFPLGLIGLISLQSKGLSRVFSSITVQKHQFFGAQSSLWSNSHVHM